jgi:hypothetical protein
VILLCEKQRKPELKKIKIIKMDFNIRLLARAANIAQVNEFVLYL